MANTKIPSELIADNPAFSGTESITLPAGTTAQRPSSPANGMVRYNTTKSEYEVYKGSDWEKVSTGLYSYNVEALVIAGGGGGGGDDGGGGGAGGLAYISSLQLTTETSYTITIGSGGAGGSGNPSNTGSNGSNSSAFGITAIGGGAGAGQTSDPTSGGCGGGARRPSRTTATGASSTQTDSGGATGFGFAGGNSITNLSGGGGGTSEAGNTDGQALGGDGRDYSSSFGTTVGVNGVFGGGGSSDLNSGGAGGGGTGNSGNGTANTGGGGGGANDGVHSGGTGGSGAVIIKLLTANYTGTTTGSPTVITDGSYTILEYTSTGSYTA